MTEARPRSSWRAAALVAGALGCMAAACGADPTSPTTADCVHPPCPLPGAITIRVTSAASGGVVEGAFAQVSGRVGRTSCTPAAAAAVCLVGGYAGSYQLEVGAPGFVTALRDVTVEGTTPACGCPTTVTAIVDVALVPG